MAKIEFEAFVEPWTKNQEQHPAWGMKTAETHRRKNDEGKYETVGRTFRTVKVSRASGIDLTEHAKGARVKVWGQEATETREHDGKKFYDLVVWAARIESDAPPAPPVQEQPDVWNTPQAAFTEDTPF